MGMARKTKSATVMRMPRTSHAPSSMIAVAIKSNATSRLAAPMVKIAGSKKRAMSPNMNNRNMLSRSGLTIIVTRIVLSRTK